jgi:phosphate transport system substrate-binding protein
MFMKTNPKAALCMFTALCVVVVFSAANAEEAKRAIRVNGAGMACDQVQLWAEAFTAANPDVPVVVHGSSAGKGFQALFDGNAEIALASRVIGADELKKADDKGLKLNSRLIGYAGLAVVTSKRNPVHELTKEQLKKVFTGEYTNWNQVGGPDEPIRCLTRRIPESGGAMFFLEEVLHNQPYGKTTVFTESWTAIMKVCSIAKDLPIGMGPGLVANKASVRVIAVKADDTSAAVLPTEETMKNKAYPVIVPIRLYWNAQTPDDRIMKFVDFCALKGLGTNNK